MEEIDSKIAELEAKSSELYKQCDKLNTKLSRISKQLEKLRQQKDKEMMSRPMTEQEQMEYFLFEDGRVSGERYKAREQYWQDKGLWHSGYFPDTQQINLKMILYKGKKDNFEQTIQVLEEVLPFIKERDGVKHLDIFEHTHSENGCWSVEITEGSFYLILHRWHRRSVNQSFKTLRELVQYVQEHHYYESSFDENQDDD